MSDRVEDLLDRCLRGDQAAWGAVIDQYSGLVYGIARRCGLREHECDDVAQSVFGTLVRRLSTIRDRAALAGWLATAAKREAWRVKKHASRAQSQGEGPAPFVAEASGPDEAIEALERAQRVRDALEELGQRCRDLLSAVASAVGKVDYAALSGRLGIPVGSIGPTRARCLARLAELLGYPPREASISRL